MRAATGGELDQRFADGSSQPLELRTVEASGGTTRVEAPSVADIVDEQVPESSDPMLVEEASLERNDAVTPTPERAGQLVEVDGGSVWSEGTEVSQERGPSHATRVVQLDHRTIGHGETQAHMGA